MEQKVHLERQINGYNTTDPIAGFHCHAIEKTVRSIDDVQNLGNDRRYISKDPRQDSGRCNFPHMRDVRRNIISIFKALYGDAMLVPIWMGTNRNICYRILLQKREFIP